MEILRTDSPVVDSVPFADTVQPYADEPPTDADQYPPVPPIAVLDWPTEPDGSLLFPDWIEARAAAIADEGGSAAEWLAARIRELAETARFLVAGSPEQYDLRAQQLEWSREHDIEERGFARAERMFACHD